MHLSPDLFARVRDIRRRQAASGGRHVDIIGRQWLVILFIGVMGLVLAASYATYRFQYWSDLETRVANEPKPATYDKAALEGILEDFDARAAKVESLLAEVAVAARSVATTSTTTTAIASSTVSTTTVEMVESE